jgi:hypothetical protein
MYGRPPESKIIKKYVQTFLDYEGIMERGRDLVDAIEFTLQVLPAAIANTSALSSDQKMREQIIQIRSKCAQLTKLISRTLDRRDQRYNLFLKNLSIDDSTSIKRLTILAAIFLPLSLASGILSMQTRFAALHLLLYDFLGVFLLIASFTALTYFVLRGFTELSRRDDARLHREYAPWKVRWWSSKADDDEAEFAMILFTKYTLFFFVWAITVVSFIVGMVLEVALGLKILGYGLAALVGTCLLLIVLAFCWLSCYVLPKEELREQSWFSHYVPRQEELREQEMRETDNKEASA